MYFVELNTNKQIATFHFGIVTDVSGLGEAMSIT
jgi:hypothetical protein